MVFVCRIAVDAATESGEITVVDAAMVFGSDKGKATIHQTADATAGKGAVKGGGLGLLVGIFVAPLAPVVVVGAGIGALVGKARDRGISDDLISKLVRRLKPLVRSSSARRSGQHRRHRQGSSTRPLLVAPKVEYKVLSEDAQDLFACSSRLGARSL